MTTEPMTFFEGADLRGANLEGALLLGANLAEAILLGANLAGAIYTNDIQLPEDFDPESAGAINEDKLTEGQIEEWRAKYRPEEWPSSDNLLLGEEGSGD